MVSVSRARGAPSGEQSHLARTTTKTVFQLRKLYAKGDLTQAMLAERFGLSLSNVKGIPAPSLLETHLAPMSDPKVYGFRSHIRSGHRFVCSGSISRAMIGTAR